jgi:hypothetical protein
MIIGQDTELTAQVNFVARDIRPTYIANNVFPPRCFRFGVFCSIIYPEWKFLREMTFLQEEADRCAEPRTLTSLVGIMLQNVSLESRIWESEASQYPFSTYKVCFSQRLRRSSACSGDQLAP